MTEEKNELDIESHEVSFHSNNLKEGMHRKYYIDLNFLEKDFEKFMNLILRN